MTRLSPLQPLSPPRRAQIVFDDPQQPTPQSQIVFDDPQPRSTPRSQIVFDDAPTQQKQLSLQEVLKIVETDPERAQEAFAGVKARTSKPFAERVNEAVGPIGRGATQAGVGTGNFVVGSVMRGLSYIPGLEGLSEKANHNQRLAALQGAYDQYLNETGAIADLITPTGARFTSDVSKTLSQMLLLGGAGRAVGMNSSRRMTGWMAANFGAMDAERSLQVGADAGLEGVQKNIYATGMGGISGGLTLAFGLAGEKLGLATAEEAISRGAGRAIARLMDRSGLRRELLGMAAEGSEEEAIAFSQAVFGSGMGMETFDDYKQNVGRAFVGGAAVRGVIGAGRVAASKYNSTLDAMPGTVEGTLDAQDIREGTLSMDDAGVKRKMKQVQGYGDAIRSELDSIAEIEGQLRQESGVVKKGREDALNQTRKLDEFESELQAQREGLAADRTLPARERKRLSATLNDIGRRLEGEFRGVRGEVTKVSKAEQQLSKTSAGARQVIDQKLAKIAEVKAKIDSSLAGLIKDNPPAPVSEVDVGKVSASVDKKAEEQEVASVTSAKQEFLARDRKAYGFDKIAPTVRRPLERAVEMSRAAGIPSRALSLSNESLSTGSAWDSITHAGVTDRLKTEKQSHKANSEVILKKAGDPNSVREDLDTLLALDAQFTDNIDTLTRGLWANSTDASRKLLFNKFMFANLDSGMVAFRARRAKGSKLTGEELNAIQKAVDLVNELEPKLDKMKPGTVEYNDMRRELHVARAQLKNAQQKPVASGLMQTATQANFLWHTLKTGFDASLVGIHSAIPLLLDPVGASGSLMRGLKGSFTEKARLDAYLDILDQPNGDLFKEGAVTIHGPDSSLFTSEDLVSQGFKQQWGKFEPLRGFVNFWPGSFRTMVNQVRADSFNSLLAANGGRGDFTRPELSTIGEFVDVITKRGGRGYLDKSAKAANLALFAPRNYAGDVELIIGKPLWRASPKVRKILAKQYGRLVFRFMTMYGIGMVANLFANAAGEEDVAEFDLSPTSRKFMQIRIGDTWFDPTFRLARWIAFTAQAGTVATGIATDDPDLGDEEGKSVQSFVLGKSSLPLSTAIRAGTKRDIFGREVTRASFLRDTLSPISIDQGAEAIEFYGGPKGIGAGFLEATGLPMTQDFKSRQPVRFLK